MREIKESKFYSSNDGFYLQPLAKAFSARSNRNDVLNMLRMLWNNLLSIYLFFSLMVNNCSKMRIKSFLMI